MSQSIPLHRRRDQTELLNATVRFVRDHYRPLLLNLVVFVGPIKLLEAAAGKVYARQAGAATYTYLRSHPTTPFTEWSLFSRTLSPSFFTTQVLGLLANLMIGLVVYGYVLEYEENPDASIGGRQIWARIEGSLFSSIGLWLVMATLLIGLAVLIVPSVYLLVPFSIALLVHLRDGTTVSSTLRRSFELYRGRWWAGLGLLALLLFGQLVVGLSLGATIGLLWRRLPLLSGALVRGSLEVLLLATQSTLTAVTFLALGFQYYNLLEEKESVGLLREVNAIGQSTERRAFAPEE